MNSVPCSVCQEGGHSAAKCPTLVEPLKPGFHSGGGGGRHSHDDDDERMLLTWRLKQRKQGLLQIPRYKHQDISQHQNLVECHC